MAVLFFTVFIPSVIVAMGKTHRVLEGGGSGGKRERESEKAKHMRERDTKNYPSQMTSTGTALEATLR